MRASAAQARHDVTRDKAFHTPGEDETRQKRKVRHRDWSGATLALLIGLAGLVLGRLGTLWIRFDVFSQFALQFALLCAAGALGLFMPRFKGLITAVLFVGLVALYGLWPYLVTSGPELPLQQGEKRLRVMQFNVHGGALNTDQALANIKALDPDVMSLVELDEHNKPLLEALKTQWPNQATCWEISGCETAIISKLPLSAPKSQAYWEGPNYTMAALGSDYGNLRLVATHTTRFPFARAQFIQVKALARLLEGGGPLIVMGDFNATPFSRITDGFAASLGLQRQTSMPSWPANRFTPQLAIDHIFTSAGIRVLDREVAGQASGSDHLPVALTLAMPVR
jgi:endonuclease/exonuclease/phosphatase (EEP) superfamily protein YafD